MALLVRFLRTSEIPAVDFMYLILCQARTSDESVEFWGSLESQLYMDLPPPRWAVAVTAASSLTSIACYQSFKIFTSSSDHLCMTILLYKHTTHNNTNQTSSKKSGDMIQQEWSTTHGEIFAGIFRRRGRRLNKPVRET